MKTIAFSRQRRRKCWGSWTKDPGESFCSRGPEALRSGRPATLAPSPPTAATPAPSPPTSATQACPGGEDTGGTCAFSSCAASRGSTECVDSVCVCAPGSTLSDAECVWCGTTSDVSRMTASETEVDVLQYLAVGVCVLLGCCCCCYCFWYFCRGKPPVDETAENDAEQPGEHAAVHAEPHHEQQSHAMPRRDLQEPTEDQSEKDTAQATASIAKASAAETMASQRTEPQVEKQVVLAPSPSRTSKTTEEVTVENEAEPPCI